MVIKLRDLQIPSTAWPRGIEFYTNFWEGAVRLSKVRAIYDQGTIVGGPEAGTCSLFVPLFPDERIVLLRLGNDLKKSADKNINFHDIGVSFIEVHTSVGEICRWGDATTNVQNIYPYDGSPSLKGFWGSCGDIIDRSCPIWRKS